jgi:hypothetical protein
MTDTGADTRGKIGRGKEAPGPFSAAADLGSSLSGSPEGRRGHLTQVLFSVAFAASFALLAWRVWRPAVRFYYYNVPIAVPFAAFIFERIVELRDSRTVKKTIALLGFDVLVISVAIARAFLPIPLLSGHVLFATYAAFTGRSPFLRIAAAVVLGQAVFSKFVLWGGGETVWGGLLLGILCILGKKLLVTLVVDGRGGRRPMRN